MVRDTISPQSKWYKVNDDTISLKELGRLRGKKLVCWCHPHACHGDVLREAVELAYRQRMGIGVNPS